MYAPDGTEVKLGSMSRSAGQLYLFYCRWRDHETGYSRKGFDRAVAEIPLPTSTAYRAQKELLDKDMISETRDGRIGLRGGSFKSYDKTEDARRVWATARRTQSGKRSLIPENQPESALKNETEIPIPESDFLTNENSHNKERARGLPSNSPSVSPSHTPPTPSYVQDAPPRGGGVCVPIAKSRHRREDCVAWAEDRKAKGGRINEASAVGHARWMDALEDDEIDKFLTAREAALECRATVERNFIPRHAAAQMVNSIKQQGGNCHSYIVDELGERVGVEDQAWLLDKFVHKAAPAASATA